MVCTVVTLPTGGRAIVCGPKPRRRLCATCGHGAPLLCDWKVRDHKSGTCDRPICPSCATSPAAGKDLCPEHAEAWKRWKAAR